MCGIAGAVRFDGGAVAAAAIEAMAGALGHRGPDRRGVRLFAGAGCAAGLGHTRLKVIDLSDAANQPMASDDGAVAVVFNGELYNFRSLRATLIGRGQRFRTTSDTEVLLRLYEADGDGCVAQVDGMFAFAIWDGRRRRLLLARDRLGKKPLFYCATPDGLLFASEIKALLRHPALTPAVNRDALPALFLYGYVPAPLTCYAGIRQLLPGQLMAAGPEGSHLETYWDAPLSPLPTPISETQAQAHLRELLTTAVERRLVADVPIGAFLSGGIDSSIVVGLMSRLVREPVRTFSIGFAGDRQFNELPYARLAATRFGTRHTEFVVEPSSVELIDRLVWHHDGPFADSSAIPTYLLSQLTRRHVTVALTGDGGDELFAGYTRFAATVGAERVPAAARRSIRAALAHLPVWGGSRGLLQRLQKFSDGAALPFEERYSRWISVFYEDLPHLLGGSTSGGRPPALDVAEAYVSRCRGASALTQLLYLNLKTYLPDDLLVKVDRCSMAHALEARSPFLDHELVEFAFRLPDHLKLRGGRGKWLLRRAFADLLPPRILRRGKMGFGVPLERWFRRDLTAFVSDTLLAPEARLKAYVDHGYVRALWEAHRQARRDHSARLWLLLTFEVWLRQLADIKTEAAAHA